MKPSIASVHPDLQKIASKLPTVSFNARTLWLVRMMMKVIVRPAKLPAEIKVSNTHIPGPDAQQKLRLRLYQPQDAANAPALLWIHGGGYIGGIPEMDDSYVLPFLEENHAVVVSVDYRLAPDHPFPAPLEDCYTALKWLVEQAGSLGVDPRRIAIGGASAGAGLAAALAQLALDRGELKPAFQLLIYPMLDDHTATRADVDPDGHFQWTNASNLFGWESYLGQAAGLESVPAGSVPGRREDLGGLPPAWIGVGTIDLFHDEDVAYSQRLQAAGVACELVVVPGAFHGFDINGAETRVVREFREAQVEALRKALG